MLVGGEASDNSQPAYSVEAGDAWTSSSGRAAPSAEGFASLQNQNPELRTTIIQISWADKLLVNAEVSPPAGLYQWITSRVASKPSKIYLLMNPRAMVFHFFLCVQKKSARTLST